jgi:hypothetical protein
MKLIKIGNREINEFEVEELTIEDVKKLFPLLFSVLQAGRQVRTVALVCRCWPLLLPLAPLLPEINTPNKVKLMCCNVTWLIKLS